jgi:hypothetical protein
MTMLQAAAFQWVNPKAYVLEQGSPAASAVEHARMSPIAAEGPFFATPVDLRKCQKRSNLLSRNNNLLLNVASPAESCSTSSTARTRPRFPLNAHQSNLEGGRSSVSTPARLRGQHVGRTCAPGKSRTAHDQLSLYQGDVPRP